jgi:hypothetical protein
MWKPVEIPAIHFIRSLRVRFGKRTETFYKQVGLRRLRDAQACKDNERAMELIREAGRLLEQAEAWDERELSDALR